MAASSCQSSSARLSPLSQEGPSALGSKSFLLPRVQRASSDAASIATQSNNSSELTVLVEDHPSQVPTSDIRSVREGRRARKPLLTFPRFGGHWIKRLSALPVRG